MDGEAQPAAVQISVIDQAHDEAMPLVEWARTLMGHCRHKEEYASVSVSTIHLDSLCFRIRMSFIGQVCLHIIILFYSDRVEQNDSDRT